MSKQRAILFISLYFFATLLIAQDDGWKEKVESQKVAFITNELNLSPKESQEFWPLYNEHQEKKEELLNKSWTEASKIQNLSEEEAKKEIEVRLEVQNLLAQYKTDYTQKYLKILPAKKVLGLFESERKFRKEMLLRLREYKKDERRSQRQIRQKRREEMKKRRN